jgi:hypothetical protein
MRGAGTSQPEALETRRMLAFDLVQAFATSDTPFFLAGTNYTAATLTEAPQQIALRFSAGVKVDPTSIANAITVTRSNGLGDSFANGNDIVVSPGYIGVDDAPNDNQVIIRFAETLPNDSYRITVGASLKTLAEGSAPVQMFRDGGSFNLNFKLDLGAQVTSVVPQPVIRAKTIQFAALPQDGDLLEVAIRGGRRVFEFDSGNGVQSGNTAISITGKTTTALATDLAAAINALSTVTGFTGELGSPSANSTTVTVSGVNFTPVVKFTRGGTVPATSPVRVGDGTALTQLKSKVVVYFNAADPLDASTVNNNAFKLFTLDSTTGADTATSDSPTSVSYDATSASAVLTFATNLDADKLYRLQIGQSSVTPKADVAETDNANSTFDAAKDLGRLSAAALERVSVKVTGAINQTTTIATPAGNLAYPSPTGDGTEPGHRDIPAEHHLGISPPYLDPSFSKWMGGQVGVLAYNFNDYYGNDVQGNVLTNVITETQKQRAREIFDIYSRYTGLRFVETADQGITVITGDLRAFSRAIPREPVAGLGGAFTFACMDSADDWGESEYGGSWFEVAIHEIGHAIGLGHSYDIPAIMGNHYGTRLNLEAEPVFPGNYDRVHLDYLYPRAGTDIDLYKFDVSVAGQLTAQTFVSRPGQPALSLLDSVLTLYREDVVNAGTPNERKVRTLVARNDDSFGRDSFVGLDLQPGTYYIAVTSTGNTNFNPEITDSGYGGRTDGAYELRVDFSPAASVTSPIKDATATALDGDRDGQAGGEYKFWFKTAANTLFVDKAAYANYAAATGADGTLAKPYYRIQDAIAAASAGSVIRIVGNTGNAASATDDRAYLVGTDHFGRVLEDGETFVVPKDVSVMIDAGATLKLRSANIDVGSSSSLVDRSGAALQVLGTPSEKVYFTSFHDDARGGDSDRFGPAVQGGQWGGLVFRGDSDFAKDRVLGTLGTSSNNDSVFLNSVSNASLRYGGGAVVVDSLQQNFAPLHLESTRPSLVFNDVTDSAGAPISADPNSFEDTTGRVGPEIRGNRLVDNSINGIFVRIRTDFGKSIDKLSVPARFRNSDAPYVLTENLLIDGGAGGYIEIDDKNPATNDIFTRDAGRLQVDPGVVVKLWRSRIELDRGRAQFIAEGMPNNRVIFTTLADNRFGGGGTFDTNGANLDVRTAGDWGGIIVNAGAKASIDQAYIAFGGGETPIEGRFENFSVIETIQGDLRLTNSRVENNAASVASSGRDGRGRNDASTIFVRGAQPTIVGNDFRSNAGAMISVNANALVEAENPDQGRSTGPIDRFTAYDDNRGPLVRKNTTSYAGSGALAGMRVRGEEITVESVWDDTDVVHVLQNEIIVQNFHTATGIRLQSSPNASLVVKLLGDNAGFTAAGYGLDIDDRIGGTVQVIGFPTKPVILTSLKDDTVGASYDPLGRLVTDTNSDGTATTAAPGDWRSLKFLPLSNDRNVAVVNEAEAAYVGSSTTDANGRLASAQVLGVLAPNFATGTNTWESAQEKSGDENRRLGFEVHGTIALDKSGDNDIYSFQGYSGSEVWLDIDKTSPGLDAMLELIDAAGNVIARSGDAQTDGLLTAGVTGAAAPLAKDAWRGGDFYTTNPRDPGMRVTLPTRAGYPVGTLTQYYVRVRSQAAYSPATTKTAYESGLTATTAAALAAGASKGEYELRIRLRQRDEKPGSTVRSADIRFPTTGIDVLGLPHNSQVLGETAEANVDANNVWTSAQKVGNLLAIDRNTISVGGELSSANDIDWFTFDLDIQQIQSIGGVNGGGKTWSMVFDIDYADGFRGDLTISVFDADAKLIYVGRDSDVEADQPATGQGNDFDDLSRGSIGKLDPFIGPIQMPATAGRYYVAVSSNEQLPLALDATFRSDAANAQIRLEPVNSLTRVVEDHIGQIGYTDSDDNLIEPTNTTPMIDISSALSLSAHVTPFTLSDVALFLSSAGGLFTHDAVSGASETTISAAFGGLSIGDIDIRPDGKLYAYAGVNGDPATVGRLLELDSGTGDFIAISNDAIPNSAGSNFQTTSDSVTAMTFGRTAPRTYRDLWLVVASGGQSKLYRAANGGSATAAADATANQDKASSLGYQGRIGIDFNNDGDCDDAGERPQVTGLQYIDDVSGTLYGVTADGKLLTIQPGAKSPDEKIDFDATATVVADYGPDLAKVGATGFTALATAPQNLYGGVLKGKFFALTNTGRLVLLNPTATTNKAATLTGTAGLLQRTGETGGSIFVTGDTTGVVGLVGATSGAPIISGSTSGTTLTSTSAIPTYIVADMVVVGEGVPYNTVVQSKAGSVLTLSKPVTADTTGLFTLLRAVSPARTVTGIVNPVGDASATVRVDNATDVVQGMLVFSDRLPENTVVTNVDLASNQITLSNAYPATSPASLKMLFVRPDATRTGTTSVGDGTITGISTAGLRVGMAVFGLGVPVGATVLSTTGSSVTLSLQATNGAQTTLFFIDGRSVIGIADTSTIQPGMVVEAGPNIGPNTTVTSADATGIVLSQGAVGTAALADLRFFQPVVAGRTGNASGSTVTTSTADLELGMAVIGNNVPANTTIIAKTFTSITLSNPLPDPVVSLTFYRTNDGTPVVLKSPTNLVTAGITTGMLVFGSGIANNTTVKLFDAANGILTLNKPAISTVAGAELRLITPAATRNGSISPFAGNLQSQINLPSIAGISPGMIAVSDAFASGLLVTVVRTDSTGPNVLVAGGTLRAATTNSTVNFFVPDLVRTGTADPFDPSGKRLSISSNGIHVGMVVFGDGVPTGTVVQSKTGGAVTLSNPIALGTRELAFVRDGRVVSNISGTQIDPQSGMTNLLVGQAVTGTAIPAGVTIASINAADREITLSQSVTATSASNTLTFTGTGVTNAIIGGLAATANLEVDMTVIGSGVPNGTTIQSIDDFKSITLSQPLSSGGSRELIFVTAGQLASPAVVRDGTTTNGSTSVTLASVADLRVGMLVQGDNLPANAVIVSRNLTTNTITLSAAATAAGSGSLKFINTSSLDYLADWSENYNVSPVLAGAAGATGIAFSPLDINLWHPTERRADGDNDPVKTPDPGHGINAAPDNSRNAAGGGTSMYFGLETWTAANSAYTTYAGQEGQYGVTAADWQQELTSNTGRGDTYNLPGGASGILTTNSFSLAGYTYTNKPTLYFTYWLDTQDATAAEDSAGDAARVSISKDGGATWEIIASNKKADLPAFPSVSSRISPDPKQLVQELFDTSKRYGWRQARVDLGSYADESDLRLRFEFSTGAITSPERGQKNGHEGFYIDDIIVGFAERGEMVTGAKGGLETIPAADPALPPTIIDHSSFFTIGTPGPSDDVPAQYLMGPYQLEMRRGTEYGVNTSPTKADVEIAETFDTDAELIRSLDRLGDENQPREQGQFIIEGNWIANAKTYGISIDAEAEGRAAFADDFSGSSLDTNKWVANADWGSSTNTVFTAAVTNNALTISGKSADTSTQWKEDGNVRSAIRFDATQKLSLQSSISLEGAGTGRWAYMFLRDSGNNWIGFGKHVDNATPLGTYLSYSNGTTTVLTRLLSATVGSDYRMEYDSGQVRFFVDGVLVGTQAFTLTNPELWLSAAARTKDDTVVAKFDAVRTNQLAAAAGANVPLGNVPRNLSVLNNSRLAPGAVVVNNVIASSGAAGILFSGDPNAGNGPLAAVPYGRIVNNTIYGGATQTGVGIQVTENAAPTLLNNVFSGLTTAIDVDSTSVNDGRGNLRTVIGTSAFHNVGTQVKGTTASQSLTLSGNPFVAAQFANFYLAEGSQAIDSALNTLQDRTEYNVVTSQLGISVSPIVAPSRDIYGQLRGDDPKQANVTGLGSDIVKDRGAVDRVDFASPFRTLVIPADTVRAVAVIRDDLENTLTASGAAGRGITRLELQLADAGVGIDPATVRPEALTLLRGNTLLVLGKDYLFSFDPNRNLVTFEAVTVFAPDNYTLTASSQKAAGGQAGMLTDLANNTLRPNNDDGMLSFAITLQDVPDSPADLAAVSGNTQVSLSWTASAANGSPIDSYLIEYSTTGIGGWTPFTRPVGEAPTATSTTVTGLTNGQGYWFRVAAHNTLGNGPWSDIVGPITPLTVPTLTLAADTGSSPSDGVTSNGQVNVGNLDAGTTWQYRTNGGNWVDGTGTFFTLTAGTYAVGSVQVRQSVGGSVSGAGSNATAINVDQSAAAPTPTLAVDTGGSPSDGITSNGLINVAGIETGATWQFSTNNGGSWNPGTGSSFTLPAGTYAANTIRVKQIDLAGNNSAEGTIAAAITVDTSVPVAPTPALAFDTGSSNSDRITSNGLVNVTGIEPGSTWQFSTNNGGSWNPGTGSSFTLPASTYLANTIRVRQTDVAGNTSAEGAITSAITIDQSAAAPTPTLAVDTGSSNSDRITSNGLVNVTGIEPGSTWQFSTNNGGSWNPGTGSSFTLPAGIYPAGTIRVKQNDLAGNNSPEGSNAAAITVDANRPAVPSLGLAVDSGASNSDSVTNNGRVNVTGIVTNATWEFSTNGGTSWSTGSNGFFTLPVSTYAAGQIQVRQISLAGNLSDPGFNATAITVDQSAEAPTPTLAIDTGASNSDRITNNGLVNVAGIEPGSTWQFSTNNGGSWNPGTGSSFTLPAGIYPAGTIRVKQTDVAGNHSLEGSNAAAITVDQAVAVPTPTLAIDTGASASDGITTNGLVNVAGIEPGAAWQYSTNNGASWTNGTGSSFNIPAGTYPAGTIRARQTDLAGNNSGEGLAPQVVVDVAGPAIVGFSTNAAAGTYGPEASVTIIATTNEHVQAGSAIPVTLNTGAVITLRADVAGTTLSGIYQIAVGDNASQLAIVASGASSVADIAGNPLTSIVSLPTPIPLGIAVDGAIRVSTPPGFSDDPARIPDRRVAVTSIPITFNTPVNGLSLASFKLMLNGRSVSLRGARLTGSGANYTLTLPSRLTNTRGIYSLQIIAANIKATSNGAAMAEDKFIYWGKGRSVGMTSTALKASTFAAAAKPAPKPRAAAFRRIR